MFIAPIKRIRKSKNNRYVDSGYFYRRIFWSSGYADCTQAENILRFTMKKILTIQTIIILLLLISGGTLAYAGEDIADGVGEADLGVGADDLGVGEADLGAGEADLGVGEADLGVGEADLGVGEVDAGVGSVDAGVD